MNPLRQRMRCSSRCVSVDSNHAQGRTLRAHQVCAYLPPPDAIAQFAW